jgi:septation ring formation regulator EzrA
MELNYRVVGLVVIIAIVVNVGTIRRNQKENFLAPA